MSKSVKFVATAAVVCLAGTCLAAPAFAVEVGAGSSIASAAAEAAENAAAGDKAADTAAADKAADTATTDASTEKGAAAADASADKDAAADEAKDTKVTLGGISYTAPAGYTAVTESDEGATYINADQTAAVVIYDLSYVETPDDSSAVDYYKSITEASVADYPDATVEDLGTENISGVQCQGFGIVITQDDSTYKMVQLYIPAQETGFTLVQLGYDTDSTSDADVTALTDFLGSIELASAATDSSTGITTPGGAINFTLPAGLTEYAEGMWADEDGDILIQQADEVMFGASQLTDSDYEEVFAQLDPTSESGATGQQISSGTVKGVDTEVRYASYSATVDGETVYYVVMMAPAADDSLTVVMAACTEKGSQEYGAALTEMMKTFDQA